MTPHELISERLTEISEQLVIALNTFPISHEVKKLTEEYNRYFVALQLLDYHSDVDYKFSRLHTTNGKTYYKMASVKRHRKFGNN